MMGQGWCPSCGWFGMRARRRNRRATELGLVLFHATLAREARAARLASLQSVVRPPHPVPRDERQGSMCEDYEEDGCPVPWCPGGCYLTPTGRQPAVSA